MYAKWLASPDVSIGNVYSDRCLCEEVTELEGAVLSGQI